MHIAYLDPHAVPDNCPEALQILYTVDALGELGVRVTLVTPKPAGAIAARAILGRELSPNVRFVYLPDWRARWWLPLRSNKPFYRLATAVLKDLGAEAVFVRNLKMAEHLLRHTPAVPLFFETHELFAQSYQEEHGRLNLRKHHKLATLARREEFVYRNTTGLVALTPLLIEDIRKAYGVETPAVVAPDGVDLRQAQAAVSFPPHSVPWLLYLGSLHPWKGVDTLIRALAHVRQPAELHIVGGEAKRIAELRHLAQELAVEKRVVFHGAVEPGERFDWIHRADICLLPLTETSIGGRYTSPLKLFEYLAAGKAIVVSDLPSMRQVLEPERDALLVKTGEPEAFAHAIERLLADAGLRSRLGAAAKARAEGFTWRRRCETILHFIAEHLGRA